MRSGGREFTDIVIKQCWAPRRVRERGPAEGASSTSAVQQRKYNNGTTYQEHLLFVMHQYRTQAHHSASPPRSPTRSIPPRVVLPASPISVSFSLSLPFIVIHGRSSRGRTSGPARLVPPIPSALVVPAPPSGRTRSRVVPVPAAVVSAIVFRCMLASMPLRASRLFACALLLFLSLALFLAPPLLLFLRVGSFVGLWLHSDRVRACTWPVGDAGLLARSETPGPSALGYRYDKDEGNKTHSAAARASASCSLILRISSFRSASVCLTSRLYQWMSLFFCQRPVGALILWPR